MYFPFVVLWWHSEFYTIVMLIWENVCVYRGPFWQQCWLPEISQVCSLSSRLMQSLYSDVCEVWDLIRIWSGASKYDIYHVISCDKANKNLITLAKEILLEVAIWLFCRIWAPSLLFDCNLSKAGRIFISILVQTNWKLCIQLHTHKYHQTTFRTYLFLYMWKVIP